MGFHNLDNIVTEKTEKNRARQIKETAVKLRECLDIIKKARLKIAKPIEIARYRDPPVIDYDSHYYGTLFLNSHGLNEVRGWCSHLTEMMDNSWEKREDIVTMEDCERIVD